MRIFRLPLLFIPLVSATVLMPITAKATTMSPVRLELFAKPGQTIVSSFTVINEELDTKELYLSAQNFNAKDETGTPEFSTKKEGLASWTELPKSIVLGPRGEQEIRFKVNVPFGTEPGGYFAGMFAATTPPAETNNTAIAIGSKVGTLVLLRVEGKITDKTEILEFKSLRNFQTSLPVDFYFRFQNSGESWVKPVGDVSINNTFGVSSKIIPANPEGSSVLPKSIRRFNVSWLENGGLDVQDKKADRPPQPPNGFWNKVKYEWQYFGLGRYTAKLTLTYNNDTSTTQSKTVSFWILPWHLLTVTIPSILVGFYIIIKIILIYNRYIIRKAQKRKQK